MTIQPWQNRRLHALIGELKIDAETKEDLVYEISAGRVKSSAFLTFEEANSLINNLQVLKNKNFKPVVPQTDWVVDKMRRKILSIGHEMGWKLKTGKIDMERINEFCVARGHQHKRLNDYTKAELPILITQFEKTLKDYYAKRQI